ncbi:MAG: plasmid mobilization relaxosome protein MobC [Flavobacteriales bacterium]|nr:plasmid mobilization relaxosome protein MobC [Flavobacteriales bacterium]
MKQKKDKQKIDWAKYDKKYLIFNIKFNKKEQIEFKNLFEKSKEKYPTTFIRKCVFFGGVDYKETEELNKKVIESNIEIKMQLRKIGTNINQIAMKINMLNEFSKEDMKDLFKEMEEIKSLIHSNIFLK